jgi:diadenosine tetraphosphate (Ap4A) HIT family hydrolase
MGKAFKGVYDNFLWSSKRKQYVKNVDKAKKYKCLLCAIRNNKLKSKVLYKGDDYYVLMNIFPYNLGHLMVVPNKHIIDFEKLDKRLLCELMVGVQKAIKLIKLTYKPDGFNVGLNIGEHAGASIKHLHWQIVPRYIRESGFMESTADTRVMPDTLDDIEKDFLKNVGKVWKK